MMPRTCSPPLPSMMSTGLNRPGLPGGSGLWEGAFVMSKTGNTFAPEAQARALRVWLDDASMAA